MWPSVTETRPRFDPGQCFRRPSQNVTIWYHSIKQLFARFECYFRHIRHRIQPKIDIFHAYIPTDHQPAMLPYVIIRQKEENTLKSRPELASGRLFSRFATGIRPLPG